MGAGGGGVPNNNSTEKLQKIPDISSSAKVCAQHVTPAIVVLLLWSTCSVSIVIHSRGYK